MATLTSKFGSTALKQAILLGIIGAFLMSFVAANTLSSSSNSSTVTLANETFTSDADVSITFKGLSKASTNQATAGNTAPGVEATSVLPNVQTALTKNNYVYSVEVKEAAVTSWPAARQYKVEVYGDNGTTVSLLGTLYAQQATADAVNTDGVTVKIDTGSSSTAYDSYSVIVTRVQ